jgi:hypothetical protein
VAVNECGPVIREEMLRAVLPPLKATVFRMVLPSLKVTEPVAEDGVTVAIKLTLCPKIEGFADDVSVVVVTV